MALLCVSVCVCVLVCVLCVCVLCVVYWGCIEGGVSCHTPAKRTLWRSLYSFFAFPCMTHSPAGRAWSSSVAFVEIASRTYPSCFCRIAVSALLTSLSLLRRSCCCIKFDSGPPTTAVAFASTPQPCSTRESACQVTTTTPELCTIQKYLR